uniref:Uncharacterized protein n=1 Tax=Triticum urartu TaxID=4572 RepID=A0A8R7TGY1_TRIUA
MQQKARFTSSSYGCFSVHLLPVVQMWRAGKFYYQSTPSSGALPLMERTMNKRCWIIGRRRPGQGTMTGVPWPITATTAGRSTPPPQAVHRKNTDLDPAGSTSNARSSTSSLSCCSVAQLLHLVEGAMEVGNRGGSAMEVAAEVSLFAAETSGSPVPGGVGSSTRQLGLKNSIQTNFGDDYVFQIASC